MSHVIKVQLLNVCDQDVVALDASIVDEAVASMKSCELVRQGNVWLATFGRSRLTVSLNQNELKLEEYEMTERRDERKLREIRKELDEKIRAVMDTRCRAILAENTKRLEQYCYESTEGLPMTFFSEELHADGTKELVFEVYGEDY